MSGARFYLVYIKDCGRRLIIKMFVLFLALFIREFKSKSGLFKFRT